LAVDSATVGSDGFDLKNPNRLPNNGRLRDPPPSTTAVFGPDNGDSRRARSDPDMVVNLVRRLEGRVVKPNHSNDVPGHGVQKSGHLATLRLTD
jgi:hypothetical protein